MLPNSLSFVDVETTGMSPFRDRIIEIGILRFEKGKIVKKYHSLINPDCSIPPEITLMTGIHSPELEHAPTFGQISKEIDELLQNAVFVAHNAKFDYSFIKSEFGRLDKSFSSKTLCTARLSRFLYPSVRRHGLDSLIERFGFKCDRRHRAFDDARVLVDFYKLMMRTHGKDIIETAIANVTKMSTIPPNISKRVVDQLPESPGVYTFYDHPGMPLYIGKSVNVKERVLSHFYEYAHSTKEIHLFQSITAIESTQTTGELGALLLESEMIKTMHPLYNRQLRKNEAMIAILKSTTNEGYYTISAKNISSITAFEIESIIGVFTSEANLKKTLTRMCREYLLCQKIFRLEKTSGRCFGSQVGLCHGACTGSELPAKYNMRFTQAFFKTKIKPWPYSGPIAIAEGNQQYIIDKWCYVGKRSELENDNFSENLTFDYDTYKILARFLLKKTRDRQITVLSPSRGVNQLHPSDYA